jgi:formylglycine-generating enzyme required for sulfatase activity
MPDVFVSYNREDLPIAQRVVDGLVHEGLNVWLDMELKAGENYDEITEERLRDAKAVVVLWSSRSVKSRWVRAEATIGQRKSTLVPAMIEECDRPVMFELVQTTDLSKWEGDLADPSWRKLVDVIRKRIAEAPPAPLFVAGGVKRSTGRNGKPKAPPKQVAIRKEHKTKKRGIGIGGLLAMVAVVAIAAIGGLYAWRPHEFGALVASFTQGTAAPVAETPVRQSAGDLSIKPTPTLAASAPADAITEIAATPAPAAPVADVRNPADALPPASTFRDCETCPLMLNMPGGTFMMGAPDDELGRKSSEGPVRKVAMAPFAIGVSEVTYDEWDACVADGGCGKYAPNDKGEGRGKMPVAQVSWKDATAYAAWLTKKTDRVYRLPTEAEWEYAGRGGSTTPFWWGALNDASKSGSGAAGAVTVDGLAGNPLGLFGVTGNVREWTQDCYVNSFAKAPLDGRSVELAKCAQRVVRGGAFSDPVESLRIAARAYADPALRDKRTGFRIASAP